MRLRRLLAVIALALAFASLGLPVDAAKGSGHSTKTSSGPKTVRVKGYTKKDGTKVKAHDRAAPKPKATTSTTKSATTKAKSSPKSSVSTVARDNSGDVQRSETARHAFEVQTGYPHGRPGYVIDHIRPLACGGADDPSNMQWQTIEEAKAKDRVERIGC